MQKKIKRQIWGEHFNNPLLPKFNFTNFQVESYDEFLKNGIREALTEINPIKDFTADGLCHKYYASPKCSDPPRETGSNQGLHYWVNGFYILNQVTLPLKKLQPVRQAIQGHSGL